MRQKCSCGCRDCKGCWGGAAGYGIGHLQPQEEADVFSRSRRENMISAAIPFLNREYQKELYLVVRLMELRRVMGSELLETRERQEEPLRLRQKKLLQAVEKYVSQQERGQVQLLLKMMDMKEILGQGE